MTTNIAVLGINYVSLLFALCFHEFAHGWMAKKKGDRTAELMGRLTMNPMAHADILGTVILPIMAMAMSWPFMLGWAKPVPVSERNLRHPRKDMFWIASAGPLSNLLLGSIGIFAFVGLSSYISDGKFVTEFLRSFIGINFVLAFFNLIPIHPLDGGKVLARFLPESINTKIETNQNFMNLLLFLLLITGTLGYIVIPPTTFVIHHMEKFARILFL